MFLPVAEMLIRMRPLARLICITMTAVFIGQNISYFSLISPDCGRVNSHFVKPCIMPFRRMSELDQAAMVHYLCSNLLCADLTRFLTCFSVML